MVQWLGLHLSMQGIPVWEDPMCHGASTPTCCYHRSACALELMLHSKRSHRNEKQALQIDSSPLQQQRSSTFRSKNKFFFFFNERIGRLVKKQAESWIIPILFHWICAWVVVLFIRTGIMGEEATLERDNKFCLG